MIELVPMAWRVVREVDGVRGGNEGEGGNGMDREVGGASSMVGGHSTVVGEEEQEERDVVFFRLESLGYRVGQGLVERYVLFLFLWDWDFDGRGMEGGRHQGTLRREVVEVAAGK